MTHRIFYGIRFTHIECFISNEKIQIISCFTTTTSNCLVSNVCRFAYGNRRWYYKLWLLIASIANFCISENRKIYCVKSKTFSFILQFIHSHHTDAYSYTKHLAHAMRNLVYKQTYTTHHTAPFIHQHS